MVLKIKRKEDKAHAHPATQKVHDTAKQEELVRLNVQLGTSKRQALKIKAAAENRTIHQVINEMIDKYLETKPT